MSEPRMVMADVYDRGAEAEPEAESVMVESWMGGRWVSLSVSGGPLLVFERTDLVAAISEKVEKAA